MLRDRARRWTHLGLAGVTLGVVALAQALLPGASWTHVLTIALGYWGLLLVAVTLLIGPLKLLLSQRRTPVNIYLRRDVGLWAGFIGGLHVLFGFQVHMGGDVLAYFFQRNPHHGLQPQLNLFGLSNDVGLAATVLLVVLLLLSNDLSLKLLRGPLWKLLQRSNYVLIALILAHTVGYQIVTGRSSLLVMAVLGLAAVALAVQVAGLLFWTLKY